MQQKRFQNKIAESRFSLTVTALLCLFIWIIAGLTTTAGGWDMNSIINQPESIISNPILITLPCLVLSTYLMVELNNANALIRIYSRMVSCTFLVLTTMATFQFTSIKAAVTSLCIIGFYAATFHCYQNNRASGWTFYAFLCIGIASIFFIQVLFFVPFFLILMTTKLFSISIKTFCASLLGLIVPYWFLIGHYALTNHLDRLINHVSSIIEFYPLSVYTDLNLQQIVTGFFILLLAFIGIIHYLRTQQNDRIRTQMLYEIFIIVDLSAILFLFLQPQHYEALLGIIIVNTSPLIAHFIALTQTRWTNITVKIILFLSFLITLFNLWNPSLTS